MEKTGQAARENREKLYSAGTGAPEIIRCGYTYHSEIVQSLTSAQFCAPEMVAILREQAVRLIEAEGPVVRDLLEKRLIALFDLSKRGRFIAAQLDEVFTNFPACVSEQKGNDGRLQLVYWPASYREVLQNPGHGYYEYRYSDEDAEDKRYTYELPVIEVANALAASISRGEKVGKDELFSRAGRLMGYTRIGASLRPVLERALTLSRKLKYIK